MPRGYPTPWIGVDDVGGLDDVTGHTIMQLIRSIGRTDGITAVVATHDPAMLDVADRVIELHDGRLIAPAGAPPAAAAIRS